MNRDLHPTDGARYLLEREAELDGGARARYRAAIYTPDAEFAVVFYNLLAKVLSDPQGRKGLMAATAANKARVRTQLATIVPDGGTDHMTALRTGLAIAASLVLLGLQLILTRLLIDGPLRVLGQPLVRSSAAGSE